MRLFAAITNDMRYQVIYGFYVLYAVLSAVYIVVLLLCPADYKPVAASIIVLTDPAMLGVFFIGGIWLLEKGEGLHRYYLTAPLSPFEYIAAKAMSLAAISSLATDIIVLFSFGIHADYLLLTASVFIASAVFTTLGLWTASFAKSLNHYILLAVPLEIFLIMPPILAAFGITHPMTNLLPGMAAWNLIRRAVGINNTASPILMFCVMLFCFIIAFVITMKRIPLAMQMESGDAG